MPSATPRRLFALAAAAALAITSVPATAWAQEPLPVEGSDGVAPPDSLVEDPFLDGDVAAEEPGQAFPDVRGVHLAALGYLGPVLDAEVIGRATAELPEDPRERVVELSRRLSELPVQRDGLAAASVALDGALARLDPEVGRRRSTVSVADLVVVDASRRAEAAQDRVGERTRQLTSHRRQMAEVAVAAYIRPPDADTLGAVLGGAATSNADLTAAVLFDTKVDHDGIVRDEIEVARALSVEQLRADRADLAAAADRADSARVRLARAEARRDAHHRARELVAAAHAELERVLPQLQADLDRTIAETWPIEALAAGTTDDAGAIVRVAGIAVHAAIAPRVQALIAAAHADGVPLGGWGYRSTAQQIELRRAHCGPTPEDVWLKPSSQCSPPTARPGASMHERGFAIDFHLAGRSISTRQSPGYQWLAEHAAAYGLVNLPSEPWHWSVNGQ
ncbi:MAG TPA: M15 family metallopeptidase [Acidimicrobiales bacterium]|nr:M15 family metallopeptidase [Acidimicrobiales bacterium]